MRFLLKIGQVLVSLICLPIFFIGSILARIARRGSGLRLVWGSTPVINNKYWSKAMREIGFESETFTFDYYKNINERSDWDRILSEEYKWSVRYFKPFIAFLESLFKYDIFFISCDGFFIGDSPIKATQAFFFRLANKKTVLLSYGSDAYVYRRVRALPTLHALQLSYPVAARCQQAICRRIDYWVEHADAVIPGFKYGDGFGRWDVLVPNKIVIDLNKVKKSNRASLANGIDGEVLVCHAPNHRGFKGTEFIVRAVQELAAEGLKVNLLLVENQPNSEVLRILREDADILIEQIICVGFGMNGLEGMASGVTTISNLEDSSLLTPLRRWSFLDECPIVSACPENLMEVLRNLVTRPELRSVLGRCGREYAEKYHGFDSAQYLFSNVIEYVFGRKSDLLNLYHPQIGEYPNRRPKIQHPLVNSRIPN